MKAMRVSRPRSGAVVGVLACAAQVALPATQATQAEIDTMRNDQLPRLVSYINDAILPNGLLRDALTTASGSTPFHPATPDAAGFALIGLCAADQLGLEPAAEAKVEMILRAYAGLTPGLTPQRSANGHWVHFMNVTTGAHEPGWDDSYSPIGSALLIMGAQFAANHFVGNPNIQSVVSQLEATTSFNDAIHPALDGRIWLDVGADGNGGVGDGGGSGATSPWNEYMLVVHLALREPDNNKAIAIANSWVNPFNLPTREYNGSELLTDNTNQHAPAFWAHANYFFNADFSTNQAFLQFRDHHRVADQDYCASVLGQPYRYGLTAGVNPSGYRVDRIGDHESVFAPAAVAAWGDMDTLVQWFADQPPASDSRYRYGMVRTSSVQPGWIPPDQALVDHLYLMFGLVESIEPLFFKQRQPGQIDADADGIADAFDNCDQFNPDQLDANANGIGDLCDACAPADLTTDGTGNALPDGLITLSDFSYYLSLWAITDPRADITLTGDCDVVGGGGDGVDLSDFACYLSEWSIGCP